MAIYFALREPPSSLRAQEGTGATYQVPGIHHTREQAVVVHTIKHPGSVSPGLHTTDLGNNVPKTAPDLSEILIIFCINNNI